MNLKEIQVSFCSVVSGKNDNNIMKEKLLSSITGGGNLSSPESLDVYSIDYHARMKDALSKNYEATWMMMGDDDFFLYAEAFISKYPSALSNLTNYGDEFPEMLAENIDLTDESKMASFERAFWEKFHQADTKANKIDEKMITSGEFNLEGYTFIDSNMRLDLVWSAREKGVNALDGFELHERSYFVIYKAGEAVEISKINSVVFNFLISLKESKQIKYVIMDEIPTEEWVSIFNILKFSEINESPT